MKDYVPITLDKRRHFRLTIESCQELEKKHNISFLQLGEKVKADPTNLDNLYLATWVGLIHEDPKLTVEKVVEILNKHCTTDHKVKKWGKVITKACELFTKKIKKAKRFMNSPKYRIPRKK